MRPVYPVSGLRGGVERRGVVGLFLAGAGFGGFGAVVADGGGVSLGGRSARVRELVAFWLRFTARFRVPFRLSL